MKKRSWKLDIEAIFQPGQLSPVGIRDPIEAIFLLDMIDERVPEWDPWKSCGTCEAFDRLGGARFLGKRPMGTLSRESCAGCLISYLEPVEEETKAAKRDRLFSEWAAAVETLKDAEAARGLGGTVKDQEVAKRFRERAAKRLKEAAEACKVAGFSPKRMYKRRTRRSGDEGPGIRREEA